jgi:hypothetical protein
LKVVLFSSDVVLVLFLSSVIILNQPSNLLLIVGILVVCLNLVNLTEHTNKDSAESSTSVNS